MRTQLGLQTWQIIALYVTPPLLILVFVVWRAVYKATNHPDGDVLSRPKPAKGRKAPSD